jgi:hypothetical protein
LRQVLPLFANSRDTGFYPSLRGFIAPAPILGILLCASCRACGAMCV